MKGLLLGLLVFVCTCGLASAQPVPGQAMRPFTLRTKDGSPFEWKPGRTTVISICAFWCDTWKDQVKRTASARSALKGVPVDFLTVSVDGRWMERLPNAQTGNLLSDPAAEWSHDLGIKAVPTVLVIDSRGTIQWVQSGIVYSGDLVSQVHHALSGQPSGGTLYLTFDDFPSEHLGPELLDLLRSEQVPATFFCIASHAAGNADLLRRALHEGHDLELHSWDHAAANPQLDRSRKEIAELTGEKTIFYRAPGSNTVMDLRTHKALPNPVVDPYDYTRPGSDELIRRVELLIRPGAIIQLHAGVSDVLTALPTILADLHARGFHFALLRSN